MSSDNPKYMMATEVFIGEHDIGREEPDLIRVYWVTGLGFVGVRFPKATTRELTQEEKDYFNTKVVNVAGISTRIVIP